MALIAIMQGRLVPPEGGRFQSFPRDCWRDEFAFAKTAGLDAIEWIYDAYGADVNPLATDHGIVEMRGFSQEYGIAVVSCCADYFMDWPFVKADPAAFAGLADHLKWLIGRCELAGITRVVMPFVDA